MKLKALLAAGVGLTAILAPGQARADVTGGPAEAHDKTTATAGLLASAGANAAQPADASPDVSARSDAATSGLGTAIVVTARRRAERLQDVPVAATTISGDALAEYNITNLSNIRQLAPGVTFDRAVSGSGASLSIRGVSSSPLDPGIEQSVLVNYDNMPTSRGRILNDALFDVQSVEILKGPQALFFGKNSPGGVVSVRTADPTETFEGFARMAYEFANDQSEFEGAISGPISGNLTGRLALYGSNSEGFGRNLNPGVVDPFRTEATGSTFIPAAPQRLGAERKAAGRVTLQYKTDGFDANLKVTYSTLNGDGFQMLNETMGCGGGRTAPISVGVLDPYGDCVLDNRDSRGHFSPTILAAWPEARYAQNGPKSRARSFLPILNMNLEITPEITLSSTSAYYKFDTKSGGAAGATANTFFWFLTTDNQEDISQEFRLNTDFGGMIDFSAGAFYSHSDREYWSGAVVAVLPPDPVTGKYNTQDTRYLSDIDTYSAFGQIRVKPVESLEIAAGGRYTKEKKRLNGTVMFVNPVAAANFRDVGDPLIVSRTEDNFSPEATVTWHVTRQYMVYAAYKTGYLAGGFSFPGGLPRTATQDSISFAEEKAKGGEVGFKVDTGALRGSLVGYYYKYDGLQLTSLLGATFQTQNAASTVVKGIEAEANYRPVDDLSLRASVSYNDAHFKSFPGAQCYTGQTVAQGCSGTPASQDVSGRTLYRAPKWAGLAGIQYDLHFSDYLVELSSDVSYVSKYYTSINLNPASLQDGYWLINAGVALSRDGGPWRLSLIGKNLTNEIYGTLGNDSPGGAGDVSAVKGDPRTVAVQLQLRF